MTRYTVVAERSEVTVEARSTLHTIRGRASRARGQIEIAPDGTIVVGRLEVEVRDLTWGNPLLDRETRRRVGEQAHPGITGTVSSDECIGDGRHRTSGTITFLDVARNVSGELRVEEAGPDTIAVTGDQHFDVRDWGLEPPRLLALKVSPEISVRIAIEARRSDS